MKILITGGAGFIGINLVDYLLKSSDHTLMVIDNLTYAANQEIHNFKSYGSRFNFLRRDISNKDDMIEAFTSFEPDAVMNLAAESHVDRSIDMFEPFLTTNVVGTVNLLDCSLKYWSNLPQSKKNIFRFHHISTDEVYGTLGTDGYFTENSPYDPSSPYSASKASSDHFVRAWHTTYELPTLITNCSNNYGPFQNIEKFIPKIIFNAISGIEIPIYGDGNNIRDWLFVEDHVKALLVVLFKGEIGSTFNIGGNNELSNNEVAQLICRILDSKDLKKPSNLESYSQLLKYVSDRKGHDQRYAIDATLIKSKLNWEPIETFSSGIQKTVNWYISKLSIDKS